MWVVCFLFSHTRAESLAMLLSFCAPHWESHCQRWLPINGIILSRPFLLTRLKAFVTLMNAMKRGCCCSWHIWSCLWADHIQQIQKIITVDIRARCVANDMLKTVVFESKNYDQKSSVWTCREELGSITPTNVTWELKLLTVQDLTWSAGFFCIIAIGG